MFTGTCAGIPDITHVTRPYETTYDREYVPRPDGNVRAVRYVMQ